MSNIEFYKKESKFCELKGYCHHAKEHDYIEVSKWKNGEGISIDISAEVGNRTFNLTLGELELINILINIKE